ncbi:MAG: hypothetical protein ACYTGB_18760 [Planctomycetota bacterium]|jgi:hypothetical protein
MIGRRLLLSCALSALTALAGAAGGEGAGPQPDPPPRVELRGLRVAAAGYEKGGERLWPFDCPPGTTLALLVGVPKGGLIDFDETASRVETAADDRGTDLLKPGGVEFTSAKISPDRRACMLLARFAGRPCEGAASVRVEGRLVLKRATKRLSARAEGVALAAGTEFRLAGVPFEITGARRVQGGAHPLELDMTSDRSFSRVAEVRFLDAEGKPVRAERWAAGYVRSRGEVKLNFALGQALGAATVEIDYWADVREVRVPLNLTAGLGLPPYPRPRRTTNIWRRLR